MNSQFRVGGELIESRENGKSLREAIKMVSLDGARGECTSGTLAGPYTRDTARKCLRAHVQHEEFANRVLRLCCGLERGSLCGSALNVAHVHRDATRTLAPTRTKSREHTAGVDVVAHVRVL